MSAAPSGRFRPVDYPGDFITRVVAEFVSDPVIMGLIERKSYSLGAYLDARCDGTPETIARRRQLHDEWRVIVDSRSMDS